MAIAYMAEESLGFVADSTSLSLYIKRRIWDMEEDDKVYGEVLEGVTKRVKLSDRERLDIHKYVNWNSVPTEELRR